MSGDAPGPSSILDAVIERGVTGLGTRHLSHEEFSVLIEAAGARRLVVQTVEAFEVYDDIRRLRSDASFCYPHSEYDADFAETVRKSADFAKLVLAEVPDRAELIYQVWLDID